MPFNLTTKRAKRRELAAQIRMSMAIEKGLAHRVRREMNRVATEASSLYRLHRRADIQAGHKLRLMDALRTYGKATARVFALRVIDHAPQKSFRRIRVKATEQQVLSAVDEEVDGSLGSLVDGISEETQRRINQAILDGQADGSSVDEIARAIQDATGGEIAGYRAEMIARTETHRASMLGSLKATDSLGLKVTKEWVSAEDHRTRPSHVEADGQVVKRDEDFEVGGSALAYPGDPKGPPEETINCRCVMVYAADDSEDQAT